MTPCAAAPDADADGRPDPCDCAPLDAAVFAVPSSIPDLRWQDASTLIWSSQSASAGTGTRYDVMSGDLDEVSTFGTRVGDTCVSSGTAAPQATDTTPMPASGHGLFFLARAVNPCGLSRWETASDGQDRVVGGCP